MLKLVTERFDIIGRKHNKLVEATKKMIMPVVRKPTFKYDDDIPKFWFNNDPALTHLWNVLSIAATPLEGFFIRDLRKILSEGVDDPVLAEQIKGFIAQEANHSKTHDVYNNHLKEQGYPVREIQQHVLSLLQDLVKKTTNQERFAFVVAGEHFLGEMGNVLLKNEHMTSTMHPQVAALWKWHFFEEVEHKAVAFDAYVYKYGTGINAYRDRMSALAIAIPTILKVFAKPLQMMMEHDNVSTASNWSSLFGYFFMKPGMMYKILPSTIGFLDPWFHPWKNSSNKAALEEIETLRKKIVSEEWNVKDVDAVLNEVHAFEEGSVDATKTFEPQTA